MSKHLTTTHETTTINIENFVKQDHILRLIDTYIDFNFIYDLVDEYYSSSIGRPSIDPIVLFKIQLIQHLFGIRSMRQTIEECNYNIVYRWFLGYSFDDKIPHFSTVGKNYKRRFEGTEVYERIFDNIIQQAFDNDLISNEAFFTDSTHFRACANNNKYSNETIHIPVDDDENIKIINFEREKMGLKPLKFGRDKKK